ncbi:MAG: hypothetical protein H7Y59_08260 [Anaerolineales bacterium]|nr:hypothetical protein [Anaerolineales bacterium]
MRFLCDHCDQKLHSGHYWGGISITCPNCGKSTGLSYREGQSIPNTEYSLSFNDFKQLLTSEPYSTAIDSIVEKSLNCSIKRTEAGIKLVAEDGSLIPLQVAHFEIQFNINSQRDIYNAAMTQWH